MEAVTIEDTLLPTEPPKEQLEHSELAQDQPTQEVSSKYTTEESNAE